MDNEMILTFMMSQAQAESESLATSVQWGHRKNFNIDQLDYLAKRLDGFCSGEVSQFQAMAHKLKLVDIKDFINLTYCCQ